MSFYRTYRPQVIDEIDNASVREHLLRLLSKNKPDLPHAYLFTGPKGAGKTTAARVIAKLFNCLTPTKDGPCGKCEQCIAISRGTSLDVIEMDAASNRGIDEIRELRDRINLSPTSAAFTIYIIDEVHMLTTEAFNALLKTLEEPPAHAVFVLATTDREKVPVTIQSRCMVISFAKASKTELLHALSRISKAEKLTVDADALSHIAEIADGSFRDAVKYLEQVSFTKGTITKAVVDETLSLSDDTVRQDFLSHIAALDMKAALEILGSAEKNGSDMKAFLTAVLSDLETKLVSLATGSKEATWTMETVSRAIDRFTKAYTELKVSPIVRLPIELAVVDYCTVTGLVAEPVEPQSEPKKPVKDAAVTLKETRAVDSPSPAASPTVSLGLLTMEKLVEHWPDFIIATKPYNHSVAGVLRSSRPKSVENGIVTVEAFYKFHQEKLSETRTRQILADVLKKLFGEKVKIEVVLGKK